MPRAMIGGVEIEYETIGNPNTKPLLLIAGLGSQMLAWTDEMCECLESRGFFVIRFDNRDVGKSKKFSDAGIPNFAEITGSLARGEKPKVPYTLKDMADDAIGILDDLRIDKAHVCGASMGGMIAQAIAYTHPTRVQSLTIMMSTTGNPALPPSRPDVLARFFAPVPAEREAYIEEMIDRDALIYGSFPFDRYRSREYRTKEYDRGYYPEGSIRQLAALAVPGNIEPYIPAIQAPTLVIHGKEDPFYPVEVGKTIARLIPGAELLILDKMGHSFPRELMQQIADAIATNSNRDTVSFHQRGEESHGKSSAIGDHGNKLIPSSGDPIMADIAQIIDDMGIAALESNVSLAGFAVMSDSGKIIVQTKNWDLSKQTNVLMGVLKGQKSYVMNNIAFSVVQSTPDGIIVASAGGMGYVIMLPFQGGTLVSYAMPKTDLSKILGFLKGYVPRLNGSLS